MKRLTKQLALCLLTLTAACPASPPPPGQPGSGSAAAGSGSGSGSSAPAAAAAANNTPAVCRPKRVKLGIASAWADSGGATVCLRAHDNKKMSKTLCARLTVGGAWTAGKPRELSASAARPSAKLVKRTLEVCPAGASGAAKCKRFTTKLPARQTGAAVNAAGTRAAAVTFASKDKNGTNVKLWTEVFDVKRGKRIARVATPAVGDNPCVEAKFLSDDYLALPSSNCAGPAGAMQVVDIAQGKRVVIERPAWGKANAKARPLSTYGFDPLHVDRASYAFLGDYGASLVLYDLSIGRRTGALDLRPYFVASKGLTPQLDPPETLAHAAYVAVGSDVVVFIGSPSTVMRADKVVASAGHPGTALLLDGRTGTVRETVALLECAAR